MKKRSSSEQTKQQLPKHFSSNFLFSKASDITGGAKVIEHATIICAPSAGNTAPSSGYQALVLNASELRRVCKS